MYILSNYKRDETLEALIDKIMEIPSGQANVRFSDFNMFILYENKEFKLWNENKYYAWLSRGDAWVDGKCVYSWKKGTVSRFKMYKFKKWLKNYERNIFTAEMEAVRNIKI